MLDPKLLRNELYIVEKALKSRQYTLDTEKYTALEKARKILQTESEQLQNERNLHSKEIGQLSAKGVDIKPGQKELSKLSATLKDKLDQLDKIKIQTQQLLSTIPNLPHHSVPMGSSETDNQVVRKQGVLPHFDFTPKDHVALGQALGLIDFETAAQISTSRFVVMYGAIAQLHRALIQFMLDTHTKEHGYIEVNTPYLVNSNSLFGTGQLPKFFTDIFKVSEHDLYLIPTAEVPVTNLCKDKLITDELPKKYVCHSPCFRSEAGSYGRDTRGMIRQHQFEKVELVQFVHPNDSYTALEALTADAETILQRLELPYRVIALCRGDLGFSSAKTYDLEVWLPGQQKYREISSCSNFETFQARRIKARFRDTKLNKPAFIHTLNGSGLAVGRTLIAIIENYQDSAGSINIPTALQPYLGDQKEITLNQADT